MRAGMKVGFDSENMKITNLPEANKYLEREYRKDWELLGKSRRSRHPEGVQPVAGRKEHESTGRLQRDVTRLGALLGGTIALAPNRYLRACPERTAPTAT